MSAIDRVGGGLVSLDQRVREAEQQLEGRQRAIGLRSAVLGRKLREAVSSPMTLLAAAGVGFAIGQFSKRKRPEPRADNDPGSSRPSVFATLMDAFSLATTVMALLPAMRREPARDPLAGGETS